MLPRETTAGTSMTAREPCCRTARRSNVGLHLCRHMSDGRLTSSHTSPTFSSLEADSCVARSNFPWRKGIRCNGRASLMISQTSSPPTDIFADVYNAACPELRILQCFTLLLPEPTWRGRSSRVPSSEKPRSIDVDIIGFLECPNDSTVTLGNLGFRANFVSLLLCQMHATHLVDVCNWHLIKQL